MNDSDKDARPGVEGTRGRTDVPGFSLKRLLPLVVLLGGLAGFFAFDLDQYVTFDALRQHREDLLAFVDEHSIWAALLFMAVYVVAVAMSLPGGTVLSLIGGFLFGAVLSTGLVVVSATLGATILFVIAKSALGDALRARAGPWMEKLAKGFQENELSYLLVLRLVPLFPFFVVNLVPAFLGVRLRDYVLATFFGIIPGTFVYNLAGAGLGSILDSGEDFTVASVLTLEIKLALFGLAVLALLPVVYKRLKARRP
ncbi:MAG: TVP38/TMEM64 family protein [Rhodospirillales bacterium]|nr:TVP38/TMEM64 family protein [Rhodospirillales bacterium]